MARVICTLPNASTQINGVSFTEDKGQMISDEVSDEKAAAFAAIPGYTLVGAAKAPADEPQAPPPAPKAAPAAASKKE